MIIDDPETGLPISSPDEIKRVSLKYCVDLLTNREPREGFEKIIRMKQNLHENRMKEIIVNDIEDLTHEQYSRALKAVTSKHSEKYKFIIKGGASLHNALFHLYSHVWNNEEIPKEWFNSELVQLFKGKGSYSDLDSMRFIHMKEEVPKLFQQIVMDSAKDDLVSNMTSVLSGVPDGTE